MRYARASHRARRRAAIREHGTAVLVLAALPWVLGACSRHKAPALRDVIASFSRSEASDLQRKLAALAARDSASVHAAKRTALDAKSAAASELAELTRDERLHVRLRALRTLTLMGEHGSRAWQAVLDRLSEAATRPEALEALGAIKAPRAFDDLTRYILLGGKKPGENILREDRLAALRGLCRLRDPRTATLLEGFLKSEDRVLRWHAALGLRALGTSNATKPETARELATVLREASQEPQARSFAVQLGIDL